MPNMGLSSPAPSKIWINPGPAGPGREIEIKNPFADDPSAIDEGGRLFPWFHCAEYHGPNAGGYIGPSLRDPWWRYGCDPASIYQSIWAGRPNGMPTWGNQIPEQAMWKLVAFIKSLQDEEPDAMQPASSAE